MNETKSVKVDNWGVFFLQKLQNFFNRTDFCDLTLQFNDNSQLKVHRLVLSACTDYFNLLEQQCEMIEDVLIMPDDLQADVIVPIINFMYTGTLEFQYSMFDKLLKTAHDMNMTVLLKLLEAHRSATRNVKGKTAPVVLNKQAPRMAMNYSAKSRTVQVSPQSRTVVKQEPRQHKVMYKHPGTTIKTMVGTKILPEPVAVIAKYSHQVPHVKGPTRFELDENTEGFEGQFDAISYESKPLLTAEQIKKDEESSLFERLKEDVNLKRPSPSTLSPPAAKKLNLEDVKELAENIRLRKQLADADMEDDAEEYYDDTPFDDDDDEPAQKPVKTYTASSTAVVKPASKNSPKTTISIKEDGGNMNHAKIISEVLKKYPHLVKNNKNIKLKILQKSPDPAKATPPTAKVYPTKISSSTAGTTAAASPSNPKLVQKIAPQVKQNTVPQRPKRIDAKTMHELISKGAENTTGPWLCLKCGIDGRPISIPSYKSFRNHLIAVHKEKIDPRLCEECGHRSANRTELLYHGLTQHGTEPPKDVKFPACGQCGHRSMTNTLLVKHLEKEHGRVETPKTIQQCSYCEKVFLKETTLSTHIKTYHREQALADGVIEETYIPNNSNMDSKGIKVLSNISLPPSKNIPIVFTGQGVTQIEGKQILVQTKLEPSSEAEALSNVASGIATSLTLVGTSDMMEGQYEELPGGSNADFLSADSDARLVTADGSELQLSAEQKEEILSQLQGSDGNVIMVLNHENYDDQQATVVSSADLNANGNIMVVYSQAPPTETVVTTAVTDTIASSTVYDETSMMNEIPPETPKIKHDTSQEKPVEELEETKPEDDAAEKAKQSLISTLQGDWTDDEDDLEEGEVARKRDHPAPGLFEDLEKKLPEADDHETDAKIADAVDDLLSELEGEFKDKEKKIVEPMEKSTLIEVPTEMVTEDADKDEKPETATAEKEICRLVDEWDDDL